MLYVVPVSSHPQYYRRQPTAFVPRYSDYYGYHSSDIAQAVHEEDALWQYRQELLRRRQAAEVTRRRLYESIFVAEQKELARRRQQQREAEYARAIGIVAARRRDIEGSICRERAAKAYPVQPEMNEFQQALLAALFSQGASRQSVQSEQVPARKACIFQKPQTIGRSCPSNSAAEKLNTRLQGEAEPEIADTLRSILEALFPNRSSEVNLESSQSAAPQDKGKGKARGEDTVDPQPKPEENRFERAIHEYLEDFFRPVPRPSEAGPSGTSSAEPSPKKEKHVSFGENQSTDPAASTSTSKHSVPASTKPVTAESEVEVAERARTQAISSIQQIQAALNTLESEFQLPNTLDYHPTTPDHDDAASVSSAASDLSRLLPYTANNASVHAYENALGTLLERLDGVESGGDLEVREARREVVRGVEKALATVESVIEGEITKRAELAAEDVAVLESQPEEPVGYSVGIIPITDADVEAPSTSSTTETPVPAEASESQLIKARANEISVDNSIVDTSDEQPALTSESLSVLPAEVIEESSFPSIPTDYTGESLEVSAEPVSPSPQAASQDQVTVLEGPSDIQLPVDEIDTFLLPAPLPVPLAIGNGAESDDSDDEVDGAVVIDAERSGEEWLEVEA